MDLKNKIKTFVISATTALLASCGFSGNKKSADENLVRQSRAWTIDPRELAFGQSDTVLLSQEAKDFKTNWESPIILPGGEVINPLSASASARLSERLESDGIAIKKTEKDGTYVLSGATYKDGKFSEPTYEKAPTMENIRNVEYHKGVSIHRAGVKPTEELAIDVSSIGIAKEDKSSLVKSYYKVKKMVEDAKVEKTLQVGDTVKMLKLDLKENGITETESAVVEKAGVSPTHKKVSRKEVKDSYKFKFNYARNNIDNAK